MPGASPWYRHFLRAHRVEANTVLADARGRLPERGVAWSRRRKSPPEDEHYACEPRPKRDHWIPDVDDAADAPARRTRRATRPPTTACGGELTSAMR